MSPLTAQFRSKSPANIASMDDPEQPKAMRGKTVQQSFETTNKNPQIAGTRLPLGNLIEPIATTLDDIDLERVVWDQEYRAQVRHLLTGGAFGSGE